MSAPSTSDHEEWRLVVGWEGLYEVSSLGRVRSVDRIRRAEYATGSREYRVRGKVLSPSRGKARTEYDRVALSDIARRGPQVGAHVHVLVCEAFHGDRPAGFHAAHLDGDRRNNRATNLAWVTASENQAHRVEHDTHTRGERHVLHKLSSADVAEIKRLRGIESGRSLAARFGVVPSRISAIQLGKQRRFG